MSELVVTLPALFDKQIKVVNSKTRFKIVMGGRRFGKSFMCACIAIDKMINKQRLFYLTPKYKFAKEFYRTLLEKIPRNLIRVNNKSDFTIELITGGSITFFSGNAIEDLRGKKFHYGFIDEASFINKLLDAWNDVISPALIDYGGGCIIISTPRGKNDFYSFYQRGLNQEEDFESFHFTTYDNPTKKIRDNIPKAKLTMTEAAFNQEILAIPSENANNPFGTENIRKITVDTLSTKPSVVYAIDVAETNDFTVVTGQDEDGKLSYFDRWQLPYTQTWERIKRLREIDPYTMIVLDSTGVGQGSLRILESQITNIVGFQFTSKSKPIIINELIKDVEMGAITINEMIANEMSVFEYKYNPGSGNISYNAQSGFHDDTIASLAMCNHYRKKLLVRDTKVYFF